MSPKPVYNASAQTEQSDKTLDEKALLAEFCRDFLPANRNLNMSSVSSVSCTSSASGATLRSRSTVVTVGKGDGTKDLVLKWSTKEQLITILNEYSAILHGKAIDNGQAMLEKTNELLKTLNSLPMRLKEKAKYDLNRIVVQLYGNDSEV